MWEEACPHHSFPILQLVSVFQYLELWEANPVTVCARASARERERGEEKGEREEERDTRVRMCMPMCIYVNGGQRSTLSVFLSLSPHHFLG